MSKAVHWTIPFQSVKGINYEIRIYDEGYTGNAVVLQAGETPITTQEDASDDFFTPVRPSTGTISVIDTDGTLMEQLLPANNISRPVRLYKKGATAAQDIIEWQGFLSCEAYQQDYTAIAQELQLSIISVLEAMDSVQLDSSYAGMKLAGNVIYTIISKMTTDAGIGSLYDRVYYSGEAWRFMNKYIDTSVFFEEKEYNNENSTTYIVDSISLKEVLDRICKFMGWVARENGTYLYLAREEEKYGMWYSTPAQLETAISPTHHVNTQQQNMSALTYRGEAHTKSTTQGAKSVGVDAKVDKYNVSMDIPDCPMGDLEEQYRQWTSVVGVENKYLYMAINKDDQAFNNLQFNYQKIYFDSTRINHNSYIGESTMQDMINDLIVVSDNKRTSGNISGGSFLARVAFESSQTQNHTTYNALVLALLPFNTPDTNQGPIFSIRSVVSYTLGGGYLNLNTDVKPLIFTNSLFSEMGLGVSFNIPILIELKIGSWYYDYMNNTWTQQRPITSWLDIAGSNFISNWDSTYKIDQVSGHLIDIPNSINGEISLTIYYYTNYRYNSTNNIIFSALELIMKKLVISFIPYKNNTKSNRSSNKYFQLLSTNFNDEISIGTDLATDLNNIASPTILQDTADGQTPTTSISYQTGASTNDDRRPEKDLLSRLAKYYSRVRRKVELEVEHQTAAALPLLTINGYDGKKYLPLAEERDWQQDTSKLTCYETPDGDA